MKAKFKGTTNPNDHQNEDYVKDSSINEYKNPLKFVGAAQNASSTNKMKVDQNDNLIEEEIKNENQDQFKEDQNCTGKKKEFVVLFRGLREHYQNFTEEDIRKKKKNLRDGKRVYCKALCSIGKDREARQELDDKTYKAFKKPKIIYDYVYGENYYKIRDKYAFLSYSKIPERAYHFATFLKQSGQTNCLGAIYVTIIPKDEYINLRKLDIEHWQKNDLQDYLKNHPDKKEELSHPKWQKNYEILLTTRARVAGVIPIKMDIEGKSLFEQKKMIEQAKEKYSLKCWKKAKRFVDRNDGAMVFPAEESFLDFEGAQIQDWSSRIKIANPTRIQHLVLTNDSTEISSNMENEASSDTF